MPEFKTREKTFESVTALGGAVNSAVAEIGAGRVLDAEIRTMSYSGGHCYITLADAASVIEAVMWKGVISRHGSMPNVGDLVEADFSKVDFYTPRGGLKIHLTRLEPTGEGALLRRRAETLQRLEAEGLTSDARKPSLARFPKRIGVIAGKDSDAKHDVIQAIRLRTRSVPIVFCPAIVQGVSSPMSVIAAIATLCQTDDVETIILARGGGSVTDLAAFDDEQLSRAIFSSPVPIITSIGHTKDRPVCDHVSAAFAPVPAKAAELALAISDEDVRRTLDEIVAATLTGPRSRFDTAAAELDHLAARLSLHKVVGRIQDQLNHSRTLLSTSVSRVREGQSNLVQALDRRGNEILVGARREVTRKEVRIDDASVRLFERAQVAIKTRRTAVSHQLDLLAAADLPSRGAIFATSEGGETLRSTGQLAKGEKINLNFADGTAGATIDDIENQKETE